MAYLSEIINSPVTDLDGNKVGVLVDIIVSMPSDSRHPQVVAVVVKQGKMRLYIPFSEVVTILAPAIPLTHPILNIQLYTFDEHDLSLVDDVLDKQIIDTDDVRVVRVNDVELVRVNGGVYVSNVDIGTLGIMRRMGLAKYAEMAASIFRKKIPNHFISWDDVELFSGDRFMRLKVPSEKMAELYPADIANIISDMSQIQTNEFLSNLGLEQLADTLEEVETDFQASLVETMPDEKVADVLEEMSPDEAADLLAELPKERSDKLMLLMEEDEVADVRKLLAYPEDCAGGLMTTEYATISPDITAEQAIAYLRATASEAETIYYVYVTDPQNHLVGVISLEDLILAKPDELVNDFMHSRVVSCYLLDSQEDVARLVSRYNLLAIPVIDDQECLHGIVTSDDALDKIIPTAWKRRLPRYYR
jgi:magnesium transporter